ncbi:NAD(P)-binding protein [Maribacter sp. M208]|uniref:phytoene desaturase family protein n=1 Tax=Maribacter huludaoensis TaxID=3030010 RepID=UPI0023ED032C|nr:NAD(P)-binding protein [Maribacter huludaoensis]MDF4221058.1 NAD(P)-binding protein [Maribacter huludaoensis]
MEKEYDCVIIGAGIAGLFAGNMLIESGKKVLVIEKNSFAGGYFSKINLKGQLIDSTVSYYLGMEKRSPLLKFLNELNLCPKLQFTKVNTADLYIFPDFEFKLECDSDIFRSKIEKAFPSELHNIDIFFKSMLHIHNAFSKLGGLSSLIENEMVKKHLGSTYDHFLNSLFEDKILKAILSARVFGSNVSMLTMLSYLGKILYGGLFQETNGQDIANVLYENLLKNNIEVYLNTKANSIGIKNKKAKYVQIESKKIKTDLIVSAMDMSKLLCEMITPIGNENNEKQLITKEKSLSSITLYLVVKKLPEKILAEKPSRIYLFEDFDIINLYKRKENNFFELTNGMKINIEDVESIDFTEKNSYNLRVECDVKNSSIPNNITRKSIENSILYVLKNKLNIQTKDILQTLLWLPSDFENLSGCTDGAGSGWSPNTNFWDSGKYVKQIANNLIQIGCWDKYGSGIFPIYLSSKQITSKIELKST